MEPKRLKLSSKSEDKDTPASLPLPDEPSCCCSSQTRKKFIGAHVSAAGGLYNAFDNCKKIKGESFALFLKNQRKWDSPALKESDVKEFSSRKIAMGFDCPPEKILPHGSYLINLGNPDTDKREKSYQSFLDDLKRCHLLGIKLYNFHPGSTVGKCKIEQSITHIADCINRAHLEVPEVLVVLETMAGQGNTIGNKFEDLKNIIDLVKDKSRIGICMDTCHIFAAGYDIRNEASYNATMKEFERIIGFEYLRGVHLNDSKCDLGSGKDRHENIGKGKIGLEAFKLLMNDPRFDDMPIVLETPADLSLGGEIETYKHEIDLLKSLVNKS